jgi:cysteine-rich repeat protein
MNEDPTISTLDPQPATFTSGSASSTWTAEYHPEANENKYDFQATAIINGSAISVLSSNTLTVTANANSACGNGFTEGSNDEECDDGNTKNNDGCSSNCTLEGILGPQCSNECPVDGLGVCDGTTKIKLCGKYDADPCLDVSTAQNCASGTSCSSSYGDASCIPPVCSTAFECTIGECIDGFKERSCVNKGPSSCASYSPVTKIPCVKIESPAQLPVFDWFNVVMTLLLLAGYYVVKKKHF